MAQRLIKVIATRVSILFFSCLNLSVTFGSHFEASKADYDSQAFLTQTFDNHEIKGAKPQRLAQAGAIQPHLRLPQPSWQQPPAKPQDRSLENRLLSNQHLEHGQSLMRDERIQIHAELRALFASEIKELLEEQGRLILMARQLSENIARLKASRSAQLQKFKEERLKVIQAIISWEAKAKDLDNKAAKALENAKEEAGKGETETVYRVYGGKALLYEESWTDRNPLEGKAFIPTNPDVGRKSIYRITAGLPNSNLGTCLAIGTLEKGAGTVERTTAKPANPERSPDPYNYKWQRGRTVWPELIISNPEVRIRIKPSQECIPVNF